MTYDEIKVDDETLVHVRQGIRNIIRFCKTANTLGLLGDYGFQRVESKLEFDIDLPEPIDIYER